MGKKETLLESMRRASADHELLTTYIECFNRMFAHPSPKVARQATAATRVFINRKIVEHFAFEERWVFPALLKAKLGDEMARRIAHLDKEHRRLRLEAQRLDKLLADDTAAYNRPRRLRKAMLDFLQQLEKHAEKENELFPSLV